MFQTITNGGDFMAQQYPSTFKNCGTCNYWGGSREVHTSGRRVTCESSMSKGKCLSKSSGWSNSSGKQANATCKSWEKWSPLK